MPVEDYVIVWISEITGEGSLRLSQAQMIRHNYVIQTTTLEGLNSKETGIFFTVYLPLLIIPAHDRGVFLPH